MPALRPKRRVLFVSSYFPGTVDSVGRDAERAIIGWPAVLHTVEGFAKAGWMIDWLVLSEMDRDLPSSELINVRVVKVFFLRYVLGLRRRGRLVRVCGLTGLLLNTSYALHAARRMIREGMPDLLYCLGESSILAGSILRAVWGVKVINRILGAQSLCVGIWERKGWFELLIQNPEYISQFLAPADLKVISNDGSSGRELAVRFQSIHRSKIMYAFNGVDCVEAATRLEPKSCVHVGVFSRLVGWKRIDTTIRAVGRALRGGANIRLVVCGGGAEEGKLRALALREGLRDSIEWCGWLRQAAAMERMATCDIVIVAYEYCNLPNVLWEGMALGKCIIGVDDPGTRGTLAHMRNAYLVKDHFTAEELAVAVKFLSENPDEMKKLGANAKRWVEDNLVSWKERVCAEIEVIEKEVLGQK